METRCPFLQDQRVAFCKASHFRKMLPYDRLYINDLICLKEEHRACPIYTEKEGDKTYRRGKHHKGCPYLEVEGVLFCSVYPVKKMIPSSAFKLECPCTTDSYIDCPAYQQIARGDVQAERSRVRGFLFDETRYYYRCHIWLERINGCVRLGLDDFGRFLLGDIKAITFLISKKVARNQPFVRIKCSQGTVEIAAPVEGTVLEINSALGKNINLLKTSPYEEGWLVLLKISEDELNRICKLSKEFIAPAEARRWLEGEVDRLHSLLGTQIGVTLGDGGQFTSDFYRLVTPAQWGLLIKTFLEGKEERKC